MTRRSGVGLRTIAIGLLVLVAVARAETNQSGETIPGSPPRTTNQQISVTRKLYVHSATVYMTSEQMKDAVTRQPDFSARGLELADDPSRADLSLDVNRPLMTFDWVYTLTNHSEGKAIASGKVVAFDGFAASSKIALEVMKELGRVEPASAEGMASTGQPDAVKEGRLPVIQTFRTYFVKSRTIYLQPRTLQSVLESRPEFRSWGVEAVDKAERADIVVDVTLPFLTWEWTYQIVDQPGNVLASGRVKALTGDVAAPQLAEEITRQVRAVRPLPETAFPSDLGHKGAAALIEKKWRVDYASGTPVGGRYKATLRTNQEQITCELENGFSFRIPAKDVVAVEHSTEKSHVDWNGFSQSIWEFADPSGEMLMPSGGTSLVAIPISLVLLPIAEAWPADQYVRIDWKDNGVTKYVVLQTRKYEALTKEIALITNKKAINVPAEIRRVREALLNSNGRCWSIVLDRPAMVGWTELAKGSYEVVYLRRQDQFMDVYFMASPSSPASKPLAQAVIQVLKREAGRYQEPEPALIADVQYKEENGITRIAEISKGDRSWLFTLVPLEFTGEK